MSNAADRAAIRDWLDDDDTCDRISASGDSAKRKRDELKKQLREARERAEKEKKESEEAEETEEKADRDTAE